MRLALTLDGVTVGKSAENVTVGRLAASVASVPNNTNVTDDVAITQIAITQNWEVEFDGTDTGGDTAFDRLLNACKAKYPSCTGTIGTARQRRALGVPDTLSTWQCNPQDGSVQQNGVTVDASIPCNWGLTGPGQHAETTANSWCAGAETLAAIEKKELNRRNVQVVVVRHDEDISWSDSFAAVRTVYEKPGKELPVLPRTYNSAGAGPAAPEAASVVLPNVGKEQHAYCATAR